MMTFLTDSFLPTVLNMSITGGILILLVLLARLLLKRAPKIFPYLLWSVVLFRLLCPVSFTSDFSLLRFVEPSVEKTTQYTGTVTYVKPEASRPAQSAPSSPEHNIMPDASHSSGQETVATQPTPSEAPGVAAILAIVYLCGVGALLLYSVVSLLRLHRRLIGAVRWKKNIYLADGIDFPFVLGLFRPRIYLPSTLTGEERDYIVLHEEHHIRRLDHVIKLLAFAALCIHWFNPLVWAAFFLAVRDMEMSCDEAVMKFAGRDIRADYSSSLLSLATGRHIVAGTPLAFGEGDPKGRVKNVLRWKRPKKWVVLATAALCVLLIAACVANPSGGPSSAPAATQEPSTASEDLPAETESTVETQWRAAQEVAEEKLAGYLWPRESIQKNILGEDVEFILYHGNGWTIHVPASWEEESAGVWKAPSQNACFSVDKQFLGVNNPKWYRAQLGAWRYETDYDPPFDYYYEDDGGYTPPEGSADYIYFFAPAGENNSYEFTLMTTVGVTTDEERAIQEAMLLSFRLDDSSHVLNSGEYTPGETEWDAAMAGLMAETEPIWFSWYHNGTLVETYGKGRQDYVSYALALESFCPEEFTETFFGKKPEGAEELGTEPITLYLPGMGIWLYFYEDSPWVCIHHAGEDYWAEVRHQDGAGEIIFDTVRAWMEAESAWGAN